MKSHLADTDIVLEMAYLDEDGDPVDPVTQIWTIWNNSLQVAATYTQVNPELFHQDTGIWRLTYHIPALAKGVWKVRAEGNAGVVEAAQVQFRVC